MQYEKSVHQTLAVINEFLVWVHLLISDAVPGLGEHIKSLEADPLMFFLVFFLIAV